MDISSIVSSLGGNNLVSIGGAIVVVIVAVFIFRSGPKPDKSKEAASEKKPAAEPAAVDTDTIPKEKKELFGFVSNWKEKLNILKSIRSRSKHKDTTFEEAVLVPDILIDEPESEIAQEIEAQDEGIAFDDTDTVIEATDETEEYFDPAVETPALEISDTVFVEGDTEMTEEPPQAETPSEEEAVQEITYSEPVVEKSNDDIFSMFSEESLEENEISQFAATLDDVDINDLMNEIQEMKRYMR